MGLPLGFHSPLLTTLLHHYLYPLMRYLLFLLPFLLTACSGGDTQPVNIRLTMQEREQIDNMVTAHMDSLRPILEEQCDASYADRLAVAIDSIIQRRLEEEARLRARIPKNPQ